ncbi:hypothetical protein [Duganella sp. Root1480D1]|uniref:hypothetical protein n=1 Tax=Duganella sp. Root1480D1 TaxID=1736471 RepID=UPI00070AEBEE|nr:hypothetical protein [Duganella sp. Root1480D1]KQZ44750.1 hypothetical protein ASD58_00330 [Duganella sp. Root1480D1]
MGADLRRNPERNLGRYWLTMSDAKAFTVVRSVFDIAEALRRDLADQAALVAQPDVPELAVQLLTAAETGWGKAKAVALMAQLGDVKPLPAAARGRAWSLLRIAMEALPATLWAADKLGTRRELLDELLRQAEAAQSELPLLPGKAERREQEWRDSIAARARGERAAMGGRQ